MSGSSLLRQVGFGGEAVDWVRRVGGAWVGFVFWCFGFLK